MAYYFDWSLNWDDREGFGGAGETKIFSANEAEKARALHSFLRKIEKQKAVIVRALISQNQCPKEFKEEILSLLKDLDKGDWIEVSPLRFTENVKTLYV